MKGRIATTARSVTVAALVTMSLGHGAHAVDLIEFRTPESSDDLRRELRSDSLLLAARREGMRDPQELFAAARAEYQRLTGTLYAAGHYSGVINITIDGREAADIAPMQAPESIGEIIVSVQPGPRFRFGTAEVTPLAPQTDLPTGFAPGQPARSGLLRESTSAAIDGWRAVGHAKAETTGEAIVADHRRQELDAEITIAPGPRLDFGALRVEGSETVRDGRIRQIAGLPEGRRFDPEQIETAAMRLRRAGAFRSVSLTEADQPNPDGTLDITATVVDAPPRRFGLGAEVDSFEGLRLSSFWMHRNLFGGAERLRVEGEVGGIGAQVGGRDYRFSARISRPATFTPDTSVFAEAGTEFVDERDFTADRARFKVGAAHVFSRRTSGEAALSFNYERVNDDLGRRSLTTISVPVSATRDARDDSLNASSGTFIEAGVEPFVGISGADTGAQVTWDARAYQGFGAEDRLVLAGRLQGGAVLGSAIDRTPRSMLFYSGGGGTVRGQPYQSLGARTPDPAATDGVLRSGGRGFLGLSGELRGHLTGNFGAVAFVDTGYVSQGVFRGSSDWHAGAGLGLRYDTGIGPIRLDIGGPVAGDTGSGLQLYIGIGQAF